MRVVVISPVFPPMSSGEAEHTYYICQHLAARGLDVHLLTSLGVSAEGVPFTVHPIMKRWSWREMPRIARRLGELSPDSILLIYIGWIYHNEPMITFVPTLVRRKHPTTTFVTQFENATGTRMLQCGRVTRGLRKIAAAWAGPGTDYEFGTLLRDSQRTIVLSESHLPYLAARQDGLASKTVVIPPPPILRIAPDDPARRETTRASVGAGPHSFLFTYFGLLYPKKGIETLLKAFQAVSRSRPEARLVLAGGIIEQSFLAGRFSGSGTYAEYLDGLVEAYDLRAVVRFTGGYPSDSDLGSAYLRAADACVLPLDHGVHLNNSSLGAALTHGLPVVATRGATIDRPLQDRANVLFCRAESPESLAEGMTAVIDDEALRRTLRQGALALAAECYDWDRATTRTVAALETMP